MSACECNRGNREHHCRNAMCDVLLFGNEMYICNDCLDELREYKSTWKLPITEAEIESRIRTFMNSGPGAYRVAPILDQAGLDEVFAKFTGS